MKTFRHFVVTLALFAALAAPAFAQEAAPTPDVFARATVLESYASHQVQPGGKPETILRVRILEGEDRQRQIEIDLDPASIFGAGGERELHPGDAVVVGKSLIGGKESFYVADQYRLPAIAALAVIFFLLVVAVSRWKGAASMAGLAVTVLVLTLWVIPSIASGADPLAVSLPAAAVMAVVSVYLAHGWRRRTHVAVVSTLLTLGLAAGLSWLAIRGLMVYGLGNEAAALLQTTDLGSIDFRGLLLAGVIFGMLGVLEDVTTGQAAVVEELSAANPDLVFRELFRRALSVGHEHISALVNTLFLAYAGASLPLFLLYKANNTQPFWVFMNGEPVTEEIVRTLVGSIVLVLAVPLTTAAAAAVFGKRALKGR